MLCSETLLRTQTFPCLPVRATFVADAKFVSETQNVSSFFSETFCLQQMFPSLSSQGNLMSNNVSATMFPCLPPPKSYAMGIGDEEVKHPTQTRGVRDDPKERLSSKLGGSSLFHALRESLFTLPLTYLAYRFFMCSNI